MTRPNFKYEDLHDAPVCGVDEVGRGPLAGPVVAAAVIWRREEKIPVKLLKQIDDSKKLTAEKRSYLFKEIHNHCHVSVAECSVEEIDDINILQASLRAMKKAIENLPIQPLAALIDGNKSPKLNCRAETIIGGDAKSLSIAAASIVAKHIRDNLMIEHAKNYPHYGWETNVGYGTAKHLEALEIHGVTPLHRRSFAPVSKQILKANSVKY